MGESQKWETGLPEAQMQMAKKRKQLYSFKSLLKKNVQVVSKQMQKAQM